MVSFDGSGESGQIESIEARNDADQSVTLPAAQITFAGIDWQSGAPTERRLTLEGAVEELVYDLLSDTHSSWQDNDGAYDAQGFFRMGDIGRLVEGDHIVCTGRKKDLIIRAGENISAKEIEDVLFASGKVAEVAIVGMPSTRTGEAVCAFIVPHPGQACTLEEVARIIEQAGLARQKTPVHAQAVSDLPKTPSGKVRKDLLREQAKADQAHLEHQHGHSGGHHRGDHHAHA